MTESTAKHRRRWTIAEWHQFLIHLSGHSATVLMGFVIGTLWG